MNQDNGFDYSSIEPTPLSDAIHDRHSRIQHFRQFGFLNLSEQQPSCGGVAKKRKYYPCAEKRTKKRRRNVGFATHVMVHSSPHALEELASCWYTRDDLVNFKSDRKTIFKILNSGNFDLSHVKKVTNEDYRGLEAFFSMSCNRNMKLKRSQAIKSVIREQSRQRMSGKTDAEAIRQVSRSQTEWARERGERFGKEDAEQVAPTNQSQKSFLTSTPHGPHHVHRVSPLYEPALRLN